MTKDRKKAAIGIGLVALIGVIAIAATWKRKLPTPPPGFANLYGHATNKITGEPVVGVGTVYQDYDTETDKYDFITNGQGYYEIRNMLVEVDVTKMVIYAEGYMTYTNENVPIIEGNNELNVQMIPV
ncbi:unnamed protein product [marine sediment metagenome]|uniref:Carboxypeptidase regulatory-like domain-containing protein n=1 Tax=marine sediment metagenome TaxID=412755 RepID=X1QV72_9ZZZZ